MKNRGAVASVLFCGLTFLITQVAGYKILVMSVHGPRSHEIVLDPFMLELTSRGHEVTYVSCIEKSKEIPNLRHIMIKEVQEWRKKNIDEFKIQRRQTERLFVGKLYEYVNELARITFQFPFIVDLLKNPVDAEGRPKFDVLVIDASLNEFTLPLAQRMGIPAVYVSTGGLFSYHAWSLNIPHPFSYVPSVLVGSPAKMNFMDRFFNTFYNILIMYVRDYYLFPPVDDIIRRSYPEARPIKELEKEVSLIMTHGHFSFHGSRPSMPYLIDIGGIHAKPIKPLPKDLEEFMRSSPDGVVYFSLGTSGSGVIEDHIKEKLFAAFSKLKQKVLFNYETPIEGLPQNVKLIKWAPQQDLIGHSKMKLFITHGGMNSMVEAAYHKCPLLAFPMTSDHHGNMAQAKEKGFAEVLNWNTFTTEELDDYLSRMLNNKSYAENAAKISILMKDTIQHPKDMSVYWLEYVIRHKGAPHLKSGAERLNFFQYFLLDVIAVCVVVFLAFIVILLVVIRAVYRLIFGKTKTKVYKKKTN